MIAAVTFDFWETLVHDTPENLARGRELRLAATARILAAAGMEPPMAAIEAAYERSGSSSTASPPASPTASAAMWLPRRSRRTRRPSCVCRPS